MYRIVNHKMEKFEKLAETHGFSYKILNVLENVTEVEVEIINLHPVVAYSEKEGCVYSFSKKFEWTEEKAKSIDYTLCEECGKKINRSKMFFVRDGENVKQVGGACAEKLDLWTHVRELLERQANFFEELMEDEEYLESSGGKFFYLDIHRVLALAVAMTRNSGYVSNETAELENKISTKNELLNIIFNKEADELIKAHLTEEESKMGYWQEKCLTYLGQQPWSEFVNNATMAIETGNARKIGYAVCIPNLMFKKEIKEKLTAEASPVPTGRLKVTGTVLSVKYVRNAFGEQRKILVQANEGFKVFGSDFGTSHKAGDTVTFTATLSPSDNDEKFGFFKRPKVSC